MESFLVALCLGILEKLITKGSIAFSKYLELKAELEKNNKTAAKYKEDVKNAKTREDRRNAEDSALS